MRSSSSLLLSALMALSLLGCSTIDEVTGRGASGSDHLISTNQRAADELLSQLEDSKLSKNAYVLIGTASYNDDLDRSSAFGRLLSEQVSARFTRSGFRVIELKLHNFAFLKQREGEFFLSREIQKVAKSHDAEAVIVATYALAKERVYVNMRVIEASDRSVLASHNFAINLDPNLRSLLGLPEPKKNTGFFGQLSESFKF